MTSDAYGLESLDITIHTMLSDYEFLMSEPEGGVRILLGWTLESKTVDAGVPKVVRSLVSEALCHCFCVSYFGEEDLDQSERVSFDIEGGESRKLTPSYFGRIIGAPAFFLISTQLPVRVAQLFDIRHFSWELRSQRVMLSNSAIADHLEYPSLKALFEKPEQFFLSESASIQGLLLPGVDGGFLEFYFHKKSEWAEFKQVLQDMCTTKDIALRVL